MLTLEDMKYYIDPIATPYEDTKQVYVQQVRHERTHSMVGKIINVKGVGEIEGHRIWYTTENGYFVYGNSAGCRSVPRYSQVVAPVGDIWAFGEMMAVNRKGTATKRNISSIRFSNGRKMPGGAILPVTNWISAADWAYECMPADGDSPEVIVAKLELAKQKWTTRNAKLEVMRQGLARGWTSDLRTLQETGILFKGKYGARISGTALMAVLPSSLTLDSGHRSLMDAMRESPIVTRKDGESAYVGVPVRFYAPLNVDSFEEAAAPSADILNTYLRNKPGFQHAVMGPAATSPVLIGTSN